MGHGLCKEELGRLWDDWKATGETVHKDRLIENYLPLVKFLAARLARQVPTSLRGDLQSFGAIGLMDAIDKFDPEMGFRFETYGSRRIRGAMSDGLRTLDWLPRGAGTRASRVIEKIVPVDFKSARTATGTRLEEAISDPVQGTLFDNLELESDHAAVADAIDTLPDLERKIVRDHYFESRRLAEIGLDMGITESRVCQLHRRALRMLEESLGDKLTA